MTYAPGAQFYAQMLHEKLLTVAVLDGCWRDTAQARTEAVTWLVAVADAMGYTIAPQDVPE